MTARPAMIFHVPFRLNPDAVSASGIRPVRLRRAFEEIGYDVHEVSGTHAERRDRMRELRTAIRDGRRFDFVYSEAATTPTGLGEPVTPATSLTRDIAFLRACRRAGIPVGLFYRDIYWQFEEYAKRVGQPYASVLRWRYRADLRGYRSAVDRIYLPSMRMAEYLPIANRPQAASLPPASEAIDSVAPAAGLGLFYVGGTNDYYRMEQTVRGVEASAEATLTICTRETEWGANKHRYSDVLGPRTRVVHRSGAELEPLYADAHIGSLLMEPIEYREFAAPLKLYEYLGHGKPIVATAGTLAGDFVEENGIGWAIPYTADALTALLDELSASPDALRAATARAQEVRHQHTWAARARTVAADLAGVEAPVS
ncbi:glycosyltransferase [Microbacterium sp. KSW4-4]|uniref:glycosyltransferase family protein n=1 Tax=Microbacterium TaxID=33882 RepID=UPI001FFDE35F|nr:glycosyltransferase [Microbacterium sp. KSW4-4]MCK2034336.1 glycosyltransferase [Microbacterium sp. KSW4-4]